MQIYITAKKEEYQPLNKILEDFFLTICCSFIDVKKQAKTTFPNRVKKDEVPLANQIE